MPGTVMLNGPSSRARVRASGAQPVPLIASMLEPGAWTNASMSPPKPQAFGMMTHRAACAAMAASAADPPAMSNS
jgi:hypothetical protein